ncbi:MFS transporter [Streptomyces sp. NPDC006208]|uniref:MFS transporter n=1 Tax=Streptomyces sp. NPDC006208 TaxID=3156734 RepID=UPI0033B4B197
MGSEQVLDAAERNQTEDRRNQRLLLRGQLLSWIGDAMQPVAVAAAIVLNNGSATEVGMAASAFGAGRLIATLFGGVLADRTRPQALMIGSDLARTLLTLGILWCLVSPGRIGTTLVLLFLHGGVGGVFLPALSVLKVRVTTPDTRLSFNSSMAGAKTVASFAGPVLGGGLAAVGGPIVVLGVNAATFVISAASIQLIRAETTPSDRGGSFLRDFTSGASLVARRRWLLICMLCTMVHSLAFGVALTLMQVGGIEKHGSFGLGWIVGAQGVGSFVGVQLSKKLNVRQPMVIAWLASLTIPLCVLGFVGDSPLPFVLVLVAVGFLGVGFHSVLYESTLQNNIPTEEIGRVASWDYVVSLATLPIGMAIAGSLIDGIGFLPLVLGCTVTFVVTSLLPLAFRQVREVTSRVPESD